MLKSHMVASNIRRVADKIEFANALLATENPVVQARAVSTYQRIADDANRITRDLDHADHFELMHAARNEVAARRVMRREEAAHRRRRQLELKAMRADLDAE